MHPLAKDFYLRMSAKGKYHVFHEREESRWLKRAEEAMYDLDWHDRLTTADGLRTSDTGSLCMRMTAELNTTAVCRVTARHSESRSDVNANSLL